MARQIRFKFQEVWAFPGDEISLDELFAREVASKSSSVSSIPARVRSRFVATDDDLPTILCEGFVVLVQKDQSYPAWMPAILDDLDFTPDLSVRPACSRNAA